VITTKNRASEASCAREGENRATMTGFAGNHHVLAKKMMENAEEDWLRRV